MQGQGLSRLWMPDWVGCCLFRLDPEQGFITMPQPWYPLSYTACMHALQAGSAFIATNHYRGQCALNPRLFWTFNGLCRHHAC